MKYCKPYRRSTLIATIGIAFWFLGMTGAASANEDCNLNGVPDHLDLQPLTFVGFSAPQDLATSISGPSRTVSADFNHDGRRDIVGTDQSHALFFLNTGSTFTPADPIGNVNVAVEDSAVGDVDGLNGPDVVVLSSNPDVLSVLLNLGSATFTPPVVSSAAAGAKKLRLADINGDAALDAVTIAPQGISFALGNNTGNFAVSSSAPSIATAATPVELIAEDLNGDGKVDIAVEKVGAETTVGVLFGNGGGSFSAAGQADLPTVRGTLVAVDTDLDGDKDLLVVETGSSTFDVHRVTILKNSNGVFSLYETATYPTTSTANQDFDDVQAAAVGDIDGDGDPDIVIGSHLILPVFGTMPAFATAGLRFITLANVAGHFAQIDSQNNSGVSGSFSLRSLVIDNFFGNSAVETVFSEISSLRLLPRDTESVSVDANSNSSPDECEPRLLASPAVVAWNSYLRQRNVLELFNPSRSNPVNVTLRFRNSSGAQLDVRSFALGALGQLDVLVDQLNGYTTDQVGTIMLEFSGELGGRMSFYRDELDARGRATGEFDFAYTVPAGKPLLADSYVSFNTYSPSTNPQEAGNVAVYNWLSIASLDEERAEPFLISTYDQSGVLLLERVVTVSATGRIDIDGGHQTAGPNVVGLHQIRPFRHKVSYLAQLNRYVVNTSTGQYSAAVPLQARRPGAATQSVPATVGAGGSDWLEVINPNPVATTAIVGVGDSGGALSPQLFYALPPYGQVHIDIGNYLTRSPIGSASVTGTTAPLIGQSMVYFRDPKGNIEATYASNLRLGSLGPITGSYNLFLGMYNWLKIFKSSIPTEIKLYSAGAVNTVNLESSVPNIVDFGLHDSEQFGTAPNTYGVVQVDAPSATAPVLLGEVLRIRPSRTGGIDFATAIPLE